MLKSSCFESVESYLEFYGLNFKTGSAACDFVPFKSNSYDLAGFIFRPKEYKATIFVLHGFLDHCGLLKHLVGFLLEQGFAVACFDLPGHGLSSGRQADIKDFSQYSSALSDFVDVVKPKVNGQYHLVGHSLGGAVAADYILSGRENIFDKVILAAPLVRCRLWRLSKGAFRFSQPFGETIPRVFRRNCGDKQFLNFVKTKDLLQARKITKGWVNALYRWNEKIADLKPIDKTIKIIQGTEDTTVAWKSNIDFLRKKFSGTEVSFIKSCRHELFNESADIRAGVFSQISNWL